MSISLQSHRNLQTAIRYALERNSFFSQRELPKIKMLQNERKNVQEKICSSLFIYPSWNEGIKRIRKVEGLIPNNLYSSICILRKNLIETGIEYNEIVWKRNGVLSFPFGIKKVDLLPGKKFLLPFEISYGEKEQNMNLSSSLYTMNVEEGVYISLQPETEEIKIYTYSFEETEEQIREVSC